MTPGMPIDPSGAGGFNPRQPVPVGRDRAQHRRAAAVDGVEENAVKIVPRLLGRNGELGVLDQPLELGRRQDELVRELARGEIGKVGRRQGLQGEARAPRAQHELASVARRLEARLGALRELAHDVVDHMRRNGRRAVLGDIGWNLLGGLEVEIGAFERQSAVLGLDQHIGEDRDGVAPLDDAMHVPQSFEQDRTLDGDLHRLKSQQSLTCALPGGGRTLPRWGPGRKLKRVRWPVTQRFSRFPAGSRMERRTSPPKRASGPLVLGAAAVAGPRPTTPPRAPQKINANKREQTPISASKR